MLMSIATLVGFVWIMYEFAIKPMDADPLPEPARTVGRGSAERTRGNRGGGGGRNNKRRRR